MNSTTNNSTDLQTECHWLLTSDEIQFFMHTSFSHILFTIIIPLVTSIGLVINASFIYVIICVQDMRTIPNFYLGSLAVGDILFLCVQRTIEFLSYKNSPIRMEIFGFAFFSKVSCAMANIAGYIFYFNSIFMISVSTVDRYLAICKPVYYREVTSKQRAMKLVIGCWLAAVICAGFQVTYYLTEIMCLKWPQGTSSLTTIKVCTPSSPWSPLATMIIDLTQYTIASIVFAFCSISIIHALNRRIASGITENKRDDTIHSRNQICKMVLLNSTLFMICLAPFQFFNVDWAYYNVTGSGLFPQQFLSVVAVAGMITMTVNSLINPLVYLMVSSRYRQAYKTAFHFKLG